MASIKGIALFVALCIALISDAHGFGRIVGGIETTIQKRPYQASLQYHRGTTVSHSCGASIISTKFLLSAAHCAPGNNLPILYARVGSTSYNAGGQVIKVSSFTQHPLYNRAFLDYDFAIVTLESELKLDTNVKLITLTDSSSNPSDGSQVTVSGWGVERETASSLPINLREVDLPTVNQNTCRAVYPFLTTRQICLGGTPQGQLSACFGDSGGPAVQNGVQYALVSGGNSCEAPNIPGIYARISTVRQWITDLTGV